MKAAGVVLVALVATLLAVPAALGAAFTPGDVVVTRVGDGSGLHGGTGDPVFLDEYTRAGALVQSIQLPSAGAGDQRALVLGGVGTVLLNGGDGTLTRSADRRFLVIGGYGRDVGGSGSITSTPASAVPRVIARVAAGGAVDTSTALSDFGGASGSALRGVATLDGSAYWAAGQVLTTFAADQPIRYAAHGATASTPLSSTVMSQSGLRDPEIFGGQLFVSSPSNAPAPKLGLVGAGLPTGSGQTIASVSAAIDSTATTPNGFVFLDLDPSVPGDDTLYLADEQSQTSSVDGVIRKYSSDGATWTARGTAAATDVRGLAGSVDAGTVTLFGSTGGGTASGCPTCQMPPSGGGALSTLTDASGSTGTLSGTATTLATPPANTGFRGVALAPEITVPSAPPVCDAASASTRYATPVRLTLACTDPDGDPVTRRVVKAPSLGTLGPIDPATGAVTYTPKDGVSGEDSFSFAGNDGTFESDPAAVSVSIGAPPPGAIPMTARLASLRLGRRALTVKLLCGGGAPPCTGKLSFALAKKLRRVTRLGRVKFSVPNSAGRTLKLRLGRKARAALAGRRVEVRMTGYLSQLSGARSPLAAYGTLRAPGRVRAPAAKRVPKPPPTEPLRPAAVPLPASITAVQFPGYSADGSRILASATSTQFSGRQIVSFKEDGSGMRCLTCGAWTGDDLLKPFAFEDGKRILVRIGAQSPTVPADHGVVECAPSVLDCRTATVVPIVPPGAGDPGVEQDQREFRLSPDGVHVAFSQVRKTPSGGSDGVGIVGTLVRRGGAYRVSGARVVAAGGELKGFTADGQGIFFARFDNAFEAANPDDAIVDLETGRERRADAALDWDEDVEDTANRYLDRGWMVAGSGRGTGLLETVSRIRRPTFIERGISGLAFSIFAASGPRIAEPWLVDQYGARGSYQGQALAPGAISDGWDSKPNFRFAPDGTAVVFWQKRLDGDGTRVVVVHLPRRTPIAAGPSPDETPTPRWAAKLTGYVPADPEPLPITYDGKVSGRIDITDLPSSKIGYDGAVTVAYDNYADEPGFVLDGVERADYKKPGLYGSAGLYSADLTVSGKHKGRLQATDVAIGTGALKGTIESELDGKRLTLGPLP